MSLRQAARLSIALAECNDLSYIFTNKNESSPFCIEDAVAAICMKFPAYDVEKAIHLPFQTFLALSDAVYRLSNTDPDTNIPEGAQPLTASDHAKAVKRARDLGFEVLN